MPYINQDDEELKKQQEQAVAGAPQSISGQSSVLSTEKPSKIGGPKDSGSFTNLNQYLEANKENAGQLGAKIASDITSQGESARTNIQGASEEFNQLANQGTLKGLDTAKEESENIIKQARTGAKNAQIDPNQLSRFGEIANAQYKGPQDLTGASKYNPAAQSYQKAQESAKSAGSEEGRFNLLKSAYARPTYSQGQQNLDNLLLTGNQQAKSDIQTAASSLSDLQGLWTGAQNTAAQTAKERQAAIDAVREGSRSSALGARTSRNTEVQSDLANQQANWANEYNQYRDLLGGYKGGDLELSRAQADRLALKDSGQGIYNTLQGVSPEQFLDLKAFDANKVISQDQFAQLRALDQLAGQFGNPAMSQFTDESQAGTLDAQKAFDASRFGAAANQAETGFQDYAAGKNIYGQGQNSQSYQTGLGGMNKKWVGAGTTMNANLKQFLDQGAYNVDNRGYAREGGGISYADMQAPENDSSGFGGAIVGGINTIGNALFNDPFGGGGAEAEAGRAAKATSAELAKQDYFRQLNEVLNQQGYQNRVKVK